MFNVEGIGCVMREWRDDVRLGITSELSWSLVEGRSRVDGRTKEEWSLNEGAMVNMGVEHEYPSNYVEIDDGVPL